jgi:hypothetical protein
VCGLPRHHLRSSVLTLPRPGRPRPPGRHTRAACPSPQRTHVTRVGVKKPVQRRPAGHERLDSASSRYPLATRAARTLRRASNIILGSAFRFDPSLIARASAGIPRGALEARRGLERTGEWPYCYVKTRSSWIREVMLGLVKTLLRWYLAVRADVRRSRPSIGATWRRRRAARHASGSYAPLSLYVLVC